MFFTSEFWTHVQPIYLMLVIPQLCHGGAFISLVVNSSFPIISLFTPLLVCYHLESQTIFVMFFLYRIMIHRVWYFVKYDKCGKYSYFIITIEYILSCTYCIDQHNEKFSCCIYISYFCDQTNHIIRKNWARKNTTTNISVGISFFQLYISWCGIGGCNNDGCDYI